MLGKLISNLRSRLPHYKHAAHFAVAVGCTREHYRRIEAGTGHPSPKLMQKIIGLLEVGPDQALGLWVAWGMARMPDDVRDQISIYPRDTLADGLADDVHSDLVQFVDLGEDDRDELAEVINNSLQTQELKWR